MIQSGGRRTRRLNALVVLVSFVIAQASPARAAGGQTSSGPPEIRTSTANQVPQCVTPERLMAFIAWRNTSVAPKYASIARDYRDLGEAAGIRWDYAFFQMVLETNYLMFKRGDGSSGDVRATQNNFAGIGATGGGVPGDRFADVRTGVLAQMQHLLAYSGQHVDSPVAQRTRDYQNDIIEISRKLGRPVRFGDLARRWAADGAYAKSIETVADLFRKNHCPAATAGEERKHAALPAPNRLGAPLDVAQPTSEPTAVPHTAATGEHANVSGHTTPSPLVRTIWKRGDQLPPAPQLAKRPLPAPVADAGVAPPLEAVFDVGVTGAAPSPALPQPSVTTVTTATPPAPPQGAARFALAAVGALAAGSIPAPRRCRVYSASYGGTQAVLVRSQTDGETRLTALGVEERSSQSMAESFVATHAPGGEIVGHFKSPDEAMGAARMLCPAQ